MLLNSVNWLPSIQNNSSDEYTGEFLLPIGEYTTESQIPGLVGTSFRTVFLQKKITGV
jgi:hypothetical protein